MSLVRRPSGGGPGRVGSADGGPVLTRNSSLNGLTEEVIKGATQRFDVEIVFKFTWVNKGLTRMSGLERCINLVELNLSNNQITKIEGLEGLAQLRRLQLCSNKLTRLEPAQCFTGLTRLESLALQDNRLGPGLDALGLQELGAALPGLRALYLQHLDRTGSNPVCRAEGYKPALLAALPGLCNLDGERSPGSLNYAELAAEYDAFRTAPPARKPVVLPDPAPWLAGVSLELPAGGGAAEAEVQQRHGKAVKSLDECEMLVHVLREESARFRQQLADKKTAQA
ncbi:hypothetical protein CHLRE_03g191800v5 [Chlamydomonas reinhardtii]|uniref:Flagellar associated protein n=1 Tax=Chlamydomonas reinhardtii TaxID=3055 RepID=A0A2K3DYF5_CHLRE|nr:uncharacterized protein CHLRE_03g191800v5 [Chlamydomonas reinhardtii]PNW85548.1 hypothetical protein CHLRE_03g191800v5 [Chlamydomonas reinhardtii]